MRRSAKMTAMGLAASMLATQLGGVGAYAETAETGSAEESYNILVVTVDQEHYFSEYPEGISFSAPQRSSSSSQPQEKHKGAAPRIAQLFSFISVSPICIFTRILPAGNITSAGNITAASG